MRIYFGIYGESPLSKGPQNPNIVPRETESNFRTLSTRNNSIESDADFKTSNGQNKAKREW